MKQTIKRMSSLLLAAVFTFSLLTMSVQAVGEEHASTCGYACTHAHAEDCGYYVHSTQTEPCDHTDDCGYVAADVYGVCDCGAEADAEGNIVHTDACASLTVDTATAPCAHADGHETKGTSEDAAACTHACGDDEWVCSEGCAVVEGNAVSLQAEIPALVKGNFNLYYYNWALKAWTYEYGIALSYTEGDKNSTLEAAVNCSTSQNILQGLKKENPYYYIDGAKDMGTYIRVDIKKRTVGDITATATNGTVSYKTSAMSEAAPYTAPVANDTALTFYFTPDEGYELDTAKLSQENIELTKENDGSYSYTIGDNYRYNELTLAVSFVEKPAEMESLSLDMANGAVSVVKNGDNLMVNQNGTRYTLTGGALTLTGTMELGGKMPNSDVVVIGSDVVLNLITDGLAITGNWNRKHIITIGENAVINWTLKGETTLFGPTASAVKLASGAAVTIKGDTLIATNDGQDYAAISVPQGAKLTIDGATVTAKGGGAGIGSDTNHIGGSSETWAGTIEMINGAHVTAKGGTGAAAIGGGLYSNGNSIHIGAGCVVDATAGGNGAAAIGGGVRAVDGRTGGKAGTIVIEAGATVTAVSGAGSAIGRGLCSDNSIVEDTTGSITIEKGASITAYSQGHDNRIGELGKLYYFAIDAGIKNHIDAPILNARFDKGALPRKASTVIKDAKGEIIGSTSYFNDIAVVGNGDEILFALPAATPVSAFATTVSAVGSYMVANAAEGKTAERAQYLLEGEDSQFLFTVGEGMTTRDQLKFASFTITATAGDNGSISDMGESAVSPLGGKSYTFTPADGYVVDTLTVDDVAVEVTGNTYAFENVTAHHTIAVTFKTAPVTPPDVTTYKITVKYVNLAGAELEKEYTTRKNAGTRYNVTEQMAKSIAGYTVDRVEGTAEGTLRGNVAITVYYKATTGPVQPETEIPEEVPPLVDQPDTDIPEDDTPLTPQPEGTPEVTPEVPGTEDDIIIVDPDTPKGNLPQTGTGRRVAHSAVLGGAALTLSAMAAGVALTLVKKKEH